MTHVVVPLFQLHHPSKLRLTCRRLQDMPETLQTPCSVTVDTVVYMTHSGYENSVIHKYDPQTQQWTKLPEYQYWAFTMAEVNNRLVLVGGQDKTIRNNYHVALIKPMAKDVVAVYSPSQRSWEQPYPPMSTPRANPAVATYHQHLVVAGGFDGGALAAVEIFDTSVYDSQWLSITSMSLPVSCSRMSSAILHDTLYLLGGTLKKQVLSVFLPALTQTDKPPAQWHTLPDTLLDNTSVVGVHGSLLAVGGNIDKGGGRHIYREYSSAIHIYDQEKNMWTKVGDLPTARSFCACCLLPSGEILIAGGLDHNGQWTNRMDVAAVTVC